MGRCTGISALGGRGDSTLNAKTSLGLAWVFAEVGGLRRDREVSLCDQDVSGLVLGSELAVNGAEVT